MPNPEQVLRVASAYNMFLYILLFG